MDQKRTLKTTLASGILFLGAGAYCLMPGNLKADWQECDDFQWGWAACWCDYFGGGSPARFCQIDFQSKTMSFDCVGSGMSVVRAWC